MPTMTSDNIFRHVAEASEVYSSIGYVCHILVLVMASTLVLRPRSILSKVEGQVRVCEMRGVIERVFDCRCSTRMACHDQPQEVEQLFIVRKFRVVGCHGNLISLSCSLVNNTFCNKINFIQISQRECNLMLHDLTVTQSTFLYMYKGINEIIQKKDVFKSKTLFCLIVSTFTFESGLVKIECNVVLSFLTVQNGLYTCNNFIMECM